MTGDCGEFCTFHGRMKSWMFHRETKIYTAPLGSGLEIKVLSGKIHM